MGDLVVYPEEVAPDFPVERVFYLYDVPAGSARGGHAHYSREQIIVAVSSAFEITLDDGRDSATFLLHQPHLDPRLPAGLRRTLQNFADGSICLVLAANRYDDSEYIRDHDTFIDRKNARERNH